MADRNDVVKIGRESALYSYIYDKCMSEEPGLYPFEIPTGHGKTTAMVSAIADMIRDDENEGRKFFIATAMLTNLESPYKDIVKILGPDADKVLFLKNICETAMEFCSGPGKNLESVNPTVYGFPEYKALALAASDLSDIVAMEAKGIKIGTVKKTFEDKVREKYSVLRESICKMLNKEIQEKRSKGELRGSGPVKDKDRDRYISTQPKWAFLYDLYPAMRIPTSRVIFLSIDKLARPLATPTQNYRIHFYNEFCDERGDFNESVMFLDESDESFRKLWRTILDDATREDADIIQMILDVYKPRVQRKKDLCDKTGCSKEEVKAFYDRLLNDVYKEYNLNYTFKTSDELRNDSGRKFLFKPDIEIRLNNENCLYVHFNGKENLIYRAKKLKDKDGNFAGYDVKDEKDQRLSRIAYDAYHFLVFDATNFVTKLTRGYCNKHRGMEFSKAATTVIRMMQIGSTTESFLIANLNPLTSQEVRHKSIHDHSFYENGTASAILMDADSHNEDTEVRFYVCHTTPEKVIADMAEQIPVWGISATALNESVIMNGNMRWMRTRLGEKFHVPSRKELDSIKEQEDLDWDFSDVDFTTKIFWPAASDDDKVKPISRYAQDRIIRLLGGAAVGGDSEEDRMKKIEDTASSICNLLVPQIRKEDEKKDFDEDAKKAQERKERQQYALDRYLEILSAWKEFVTHPDMDSALFFGNAYIKEPRNIKPGSSAINEKTLRQCITHINNLFGYNDDENEFVKLTNDDLKDVDEKMKTALDNAYRNGERRFIYTIYKAAGTGKNLQHKFKSGKNLVKVALNRADTDRKDYDMIFLTEPTHIIKTTGYDPASGRSRAEDTLEFLVQAECLSDPYTGELSEFEKAALIEAKAAGTKPTVSGLKGRNSEVAGAVNVMIQAIGRIGRSPYRNRNVYIGFTTAAAKDIATANETEHNFAREVSEVLRSDIAANIKAEAMTEQPDTTGQKSRNERLIELFNKDAHDTIHSTMYRDPATGEFDDMSGWKGIREGVLKNVRTQEEFDAIHHAARLVYWQIPGLSVKEGDYSYTVLDRGFGDTREVAVSLDPDRQFKRAVTSEATRLADLLLVRGNRKHFESKSYRTDLDMADFGLPPVTVQSIFMGAAAEETGMFAINEDIKRLGLDLSLTDITDPVDFEMFDAVFKGTNVYVDFKNYTEGTNTKDEDILEGPNKGIAKAKQVGAKTIIYTQMTARNRHKKSDFVKDGVRVIELPGMYTITNGVAVRNDEFFDLLYEAARG